MMSPTFFTYDKAFVMGMLCFPASGRTGRRPAGSSAILLIGTLTCTGFLIVRSDLLELTHGLPEVGVFPSEDARRSMYKGTHVP